MSILRSCFLSLVVLAADEGASLELLASRVAKQATPLVGGWVERLRSRYKEIPGFRNLEFNDVSFFLASDVLLDNWQIRAVERGWSGVDRPLRGRARYYCSIAAITDPRRESFGIYGNQSAGVGGGRSIGVYGNSRGRGNDLASLSQSKLAALAALPDSVKRDVLVSRVLDRMQLWAREDGTAHDSVPAQFVAVRRHSFAPLGPRHPGRTRSCSRNLAFGSITSFTPR